MCPIGMLLAFLWEWQQTVSTLFPIKYLRFLNAFESIFYQAYQTTAINSLDDKERNNFYSRIFNNYFVFMMLGYVGILVVSRPMIIYLFDSSYADSWLYIPPLLAGAVAHAIASNLGSYYVLFYQTKGAFLTSVWGALTNIALNFFCSFPILDLWQRL